MKVGVTGHQSRIEIDWEWVTRTTFEQLNALNQPLIGYSSLAAGADQIFADAILKLGGTLEIVLPFANYEATFQKNADISRFRRLAAAAKAVTELSGGNSEEESYLLAGMQIVDLSDVLFAIWDGKPAAGKGGTADVVAHALRSKKQIVHINTATKISSVLGKE